MSLAQRIAAAEQKLGTRGCQECRSTPNPIYSAADYPGPLDCAACGRRIMSIVVHGLEAVAAN